MIWVVVALCIVSVNSFLPSYLAPGVRPVPYQQMPFPAHMMRHKTPTVHNSRSVEDSLDAGAMQAYANAPFLEQDDDENCESMPNRTRYRPAFYQCSEGTLFTLHGGAVTNATGDDRYPVSFSEPIRVFLDVTSDARRRYDNLGVEVSLYKRSSGWFGCGWMFLPSFGMLSDSDMCEDNPSCPVAPGRQVIEFTVDPSRLFTRLFRMIHHDMSAYQLVVRLVDNRNPYDELLCATIQTRIIL